MARFEDVISATAVSAAELEVQLPDAAKAPVIPVPEQTRRPVACWTIDEQTGRPVCRWVLA